MADERAPKHADRELIELRVHGVSGTPPTVVLSDAYPTQVTGDHFAGFFDGTTVDDGPEDA